MKFASIISSFLLLLMFVSCNSDDEQGLNINFRLQYDAEPLVFFEEYEYPDGRSIEFTRFSFYISDLMSSKDGESLLLKSDDYIDLTLSHSTAEDAANGFDYVNETGALSEFDGISFNIGLTEDQNSTKPEEYESSSSLSLSGEYWSNWESYVFVKIEARTDLDGDGISDGVALHLGADSAMRTINISNLDSEKTINISLDLKDVFEHDGEIFDIENNSRIHSLNQLPLIDWLMDSLQENTHISQ